MTPVPVRFFGLKPFNVHHWTIISAELFDYREALLGQFLREYGLSESLIRLFCPPGLTNRFISSFVFWTYMWNRRASGPTMYPFIALNPCIALHGVGV